MIRSIPILSILLLGTACVVIAEDRKAEVTVLFDGSSLEAWECEPGAWYADAKGRLACRMREVVARDGTTRIRGRGYLWTKESYGDFELTLEYRLSEGANSGVFYRTDPENPVHGGFEIQLMDDEGFQETHGRKDARKLNGSFYDAKAPAEHPVNPPGEWNTLKLRCDGPEITCWINGVETFSVDVGEWDTAGKNPDGTANKFRRALAELPREGRIGLQNHGQHVWFRDIRIRRLD